MPTNVACPKCSTKYKIPDKLLGKAVKCQKCGASFRVGGKKPAAAPAGQTSAKSNRPTTKSSELAKFGLDGPIRSDDLDIFDSSPASAPPPNALGNHALDPGFVPPQPKDENAEVDPNELFVNPALAPKKKKKMSIDSYQPTRERLGDFDGEPFVFKDAIKLPWFLLLMVLGVVALICTVVPYMLGPEYAWITFVGMGICGLASFVVNMWGLVLAYQTTGEVVTLILCLFVPFYFLYFLIVNWSAMKPFAAAAGVCLITCLFHVPFLFLNTY